MAVGDPVATVFEDVEVDGRPGRWVGVARGMVRAVGDEGRRPEGCWREATVVDGSGGALLPGLHDHHLHLRAMAARATSVTCGPPEVRDRGALGAALRSAAAAVDAGRWVRGTGYDEATTGSLDAAILDDLLGPHRHVPVRVQHRTGHLWVLNRAGVDLVDRDGRVGRGEHGLGVYLDRDDRLRAAWGSGEDALTGGMAAVSQDLAGFGITGATDATVTNGPSEVAALEEAQSSGLLPQRLHVLGRGLGRPGGGRITTGPLKIVLAEHDLPALADLVAEIAGADEAGVAIHCVSREAVVLAAVALREVPTVTARLEHAAVAPPDTLDLLAGRPVTVVTQPGFVFQHGDRYRRDVDVVDRPWLYRLAGWRRAGVGLAGSSDAPFGDADPWSAMRAAVERRTVGGAVLGAEEALTPEAARDLYLAPLDDPGGPPRRVEPGAPGDLCLLAVPWRVARGGLSAEHVRATYVAGTLVASR